MNEDFPAIRVFPMPEALAEGAAEMIFAAQAQSLAHDRDFVLALSGGATPQRLFALLARDPWASKLNWRRTHLLFVDERCVPASDPQSNFGAASHALLDHVPLPFPQVHRMAGEKEPSLAAAEYDRLLLEQFDDGPDLVLLGLGQDGHTASLFPGTSALEESEKRCVANFVPALGTWRLTMTYPYINRARQVAVLVEGQAKSRIVNSVLEGRAHPGEFPIQGIRPLSGNLQWLLDVAAAGMNDLED